MPFLHKFVVSAAKRVVADLLGFVLPEIADAVNAGKTFNTAEKSVARQNLRKQLASGSRKKRGAIGGKELAYGSQASRFIPTKSAKQTSRSRRDIFTNISH